jgi:hypothetical protein
MLVSDPFPSSSAGDILLDWRYSGAVSDLGRILQLIGLIIVPTALLRPEPLEMFGILLVGAGVFLVGRYLVRNTKE